MGRHNSLDTTGLQREIEQAARMAGPEPPLHQLHLLRMEPILDESVRVEPNPPLIGRSLYERIWVVINRAQRPVARHGVEPAVVAQNDVNAALRRSLDRLMAADAALHAEITRLRAGSKHE